MKTSKKVFKEYNKNKEEMFVKMSNDGEYIYFTLYNDVKCELHHQRGILVAKYLKKDEDYGNIPINDFPYIKICDIIVRNNNIGNGSILMNYFMEYCKTTNAKYIAAWLSPVDMDHFDRLEHFYKKYGFSVTFNGYRTSGSIKYIL